VLLGESGGGGRGFSFVRGPVWRAPERLIKDARSPQFAHANRLPRAPLRGACRVPDSRSAARA
jgi:hypothetical protein